jgi:hypothetical protein
MEHSRQQLPAPRRAAYQTIESFVYQYYFLCMDNAKKAGYTLGPLPWSEQTLTKAYWHNFSAAQRAVKEHPGREFYERSLSLKSTLRIFNKAVALFLLHVERFHQQAYQGEIFRRNRREELCQLEEELQDAVYLFASSAMTLVDCSSPQLNRTQMH